MTQPKPTTLLLSHTDRDGILAAATLLRGLRPQAGPAPLVLLTQGCYLASELEDLAEAGQRFEAIHVCDTYWHAAHAGRLAAGFRALLAPGGTLTWIDHHPASVASEARMRELLPGLQTRIRGDREGVHEAVSLVIQQFGLGDDPVAMLLLQAIQLRWLRQGQPVPAAVQDWLNVIDALGRRPDLAAGQAAAIVHQLAEGFTRPLPENLRPLAQLTEACQARTRELVLADWPRLPSVADGWGLFLDLRAEPMAIPYQLQWALFHAADRRIDYFVVQEAAGSVHYVSGRSARALRNQLECAGGCPALRVATFHKGGRNRLSWRANQGIDLSYLTRRRPAAGALGDWIDAHPYLVKAPWLQVGPDPAQARQAAEAIGQAMLHMLGSFGWRDEDRSWLTRSRPVRVKSPSLPC